MCGLLHQITKFQASCLTHSNFWTHVSFESPDARLILGCRPTHRLLPENRAAVAGRHSLRARPQCCGAQKTPGPLQHEGHKAISSPCQRGWRCRHCAPLGQRQKFDTLAQIQGARLLACALVRTDRACLALSGASLTGHPGPNNRVHEQNVPLLTLLI